MSAQEKDPRGGPPKNDPRGGHRAAPQIPADLQENFGILAEAFRRGDASLILGVDSAGRPVTLLAVAIRDPEQPDGQGMEVIPLAVMEPPESLMAKYPIPGMQLVQDPPKEPVLLNPKALRDIGAWLPHVRSIRHPYGADGFNAQWVKGAEEISARYGLTPRQFLAHVRYIDHHRGGPRQREGGSL